MSSSGKAPTTGDRVAAADGSSTFSGGSRHAIAAEGQALLVSLRLTDPGNSAPLTAIAAR
jgi:hypothetical protein